jgi:adenine-specific DNA methylase
MYAKLILDRGGHRVYATVSLAEEACARECTLRQIPDRRQKNVPSELFDANGIRHTWMMQYGIKTTADLYGHRQGVALLEVFYEIENVKKQLLAQYGDGDTAKVLIALLALTFNRLVAYGTRHAWWQSNGEFPANMYVRQAIPMVWNYVEMPVSSVGAAGWSSATVWLEKVIAHLAKLPQKGAVWQGDAAHCPLSRESVDLVAIDPPYFDSIAYSYLSDPFYVWMKAILGDLYPDEYQMVLSPKAEEAIVDRQHSLAPSPKTKEHFREKITQALVEARRILKPEGRLVIMFGHKELEAWETVLGALIDAGFLPTASWPIHTERKAKFRHGHIDALSSSCLMMCIPEASGQKQDISWSEFEIKLRDVLVTSIALFQAAHFFGADLVTSLIAPACTLFRSYSVSAEDKKQLTIGQLIELLPALAEECELEAVMGQAGIGAHRELVQVVESLAIQKTSQRGVTNGSEREKTWLDYAEHNPMIELAVRYAKLLPEGKVVEADELWRKLPLQDKELLCHLLRALALVSREDSMGKQLAQAGLGRMSLQIRSRDVEPNGELIKPWLPGLDSLR